MLHYPSFLHPVAFKVGPLQVHWYGLMYLFAFVLVTLLAVYRAKNTATIWQGEQVVDRITDLIFYLALGVIVGGRLGSVFFYNLAEFTQNPLMLFEIWRGGMSFHGGLIGVLVAALIYTRFHNIRFFDLMDFVAPFVPIGLGLGRVGNFINDELWGRIAHVPWAMVFPNAADPLNPANNPPRHPSQIYEFLLEGVLLFAILWWFSTKPKPRGVISGLFLFLYGSFRFFVEFFRQPDANIGFLFHTDWLTMGQLLSVPMIILGVVLFIVFNKKKEYPQISV